MHTSRLENEEIKKNQHLFVSLSKEMNSAICSITVRPHLTDAEYRRTESIVSNFGSGIGKDLHEKLVQRHKFSRNWVKM